MSRYLCHSPIGMLENSLPSLCKQYSCQLFVLTYLTQNPRLCKWVGLRIVHRGMTRDGCCEIQIGYTSINTKTKHDLTYTIMEWSNGLFDVCYKVHMCSKRHLSYKSNVFILFYNPVFYGFWACGNWLWNPFDNSRSLYDLNATNRGLGDPWGLLQSPSWSVFKVLLCSYCSTTKFLWFLGMWKLIMTSIW